MNAGIRRIAITGGAGFIGRHFVRRFASNGTHVATLDIRPPARPESGERVIVGDVRDPSAVRVALAGCDAVLHLAAAHHDFGIDRETFFSVNEGGTRVLTSVMAEVGIGRICFTSTVAVYGSDPESTDEGSTCSPDSHYGVSKLAAETVVQAWAKEVPGRRALIVRPAVVFGPGNFANMYTLIRQIDSGLYMSVGEGDNRKSLAYVDNLVQAVMDLWSDDGNPVSLYNIVDKPDLTSRAIESAVYQALGKGLRRVRVPYWLASAAAKPCDLVIAATGWNLPISSARIHKFARAHTVFDAQRLEAAGITPTTSPLEGIKAMVEWYLEEGKDLPVDRSIPPPTTMPYVPAELSEPT